MAIAFVRSTGHVTGNGVDSQAASFAALPAAGNSVIVPVSCWNRSLVPGSVTENQGNSYTMDVNIIVGAARNSIHSNIEIGSPSGTFTITVNPPTSSTDYFEFCGVEFSGLADASAVDISATNDQTA